MARKKIVLPARPAGFDARQRVWRHNAFSGHAAMMKSQLNAIAASDTATPEAKHIANQMLKWVPDLAKALKTRIDP